MVSIKEVAKHAGVAISTVSKVLNGYPNVSEETKKKVQDAIKELNYIPNSIAAALSSKQFGRIALVLDPNRQTQAIDQIFMQYLVGALDKAKELNVEVVTIFPSMIAGMTAEEITRSFLSQSISGGVSYGMSKEDKVILETETQGDINGDGKITYIMCKGDPENIDAQYRTEYSIKALTDAGKEVECLYEYLDNWDQTTAQQDVANALSQYGDKIEVVFCNNDAMALGALQSIQQANRTVGKDIYLVGVDALAEAVQDVLDGNMTGTVLNDDVGQATAAAEATKLYVEGSKVEQYYWVDYVKVTKDNASEYAK